MISLKLSFSSEEDLNLAAFIVDLLGLGFLFSQRGFRAGIWIFDSRKESDKALEALKEAGVFLISKEV